MPEMFDQSQKPIFDAAIHSFSSPKAIFDDFLYLDHPFIHIHPHLPMPHKTSTPGISNTHHHPHNSNPHTQKYTGNPNKQVLILGNTRPSGKMFINPCIFKTK